MPFTPAHALAVLPLRVLRLPLAPLVIGSISPDLGYYLPLRPGRAISHTPLGLVTVDLAFAVVALLVWWTLVREPLVDAVPSVVRTRWRTPTEGDAGWPVITARLVGLSLVAMLLGSLTHVGWDAFTHEGRWGVRHVAWLSEQHGRWPGYRWAQYGSGVIGLLGVTAYAVVVLRRTPPQPVPVRVPRLRPWLWIVPVVLTLVGGAVGGRAGLPTGLRRAAFDALTYGMGAGAAGLLVVCLVWHRLASSGGADGARSTPVD